MRHFSPQAIKPCVIALLFCTLSACGSDSSSGDEGLIAATTELPPSSTEGGAIGEFNATATRDVYACEAPYYLGVRGHYLGTIGYTAPGDSTETCTWDATLRVRGSYASEDDTSSCLIDATYTYTLISGTSPCADGAVDGSLKDPLAASSNRLEWADPQWPIELTLNASVELSEDDTIFPVSGQSSNSLDVQWRFDGLGEAILIDDDTTNGSLAGILVEL